VKVIRQKGSETQIYYIDLLKEDFLESPYYYVQQNDVIIVPLVLATLAVNRTVRFLASILVHLLDFAFPLAMQLVWLPLLAIRMIGDGIVAVFRGILRTLPLGDTRRRRWAEAMRRNWEWLRERISYRAFEHAVHVAFESGMAWVFRKCRRLTPNKALLVIVGAILWLPISFGAATALHMILVAKVASWPAWMQLLHPLGTVIAKSKLLVLPAYPAAWPQAKQHWLVQASFRVYQYLAARYLMRKIGFRYRQTERAATDGTRVLRRSAGRIGLRQLSGRLLDGLNDLAARIGRAMRAIATGTMQGLSGLPLAGPIIRRYQAHYDAAAEQKSPQKLSENVKGFFERWSVKLSVEYYEAKDATTSHVARSHAAQSEVAQSQLAQSQAARSQVAQGHAAVPVASPPGSSPPPARDLR